MDGLFSPGRIGTLEVKNRIIRSASHEGLADRQGAHGPAPPAPDG
jgi:2,4-dienoyl-CoA reductase-like NADH-dependent reductase (Old Yellow Enzyme family)